jgi:hypothetical protein
MSDPGIMSVAFQRKGQPETAQFIHVAMHFDLSHLLELGLEFPRVRLRPGPFGAEIAGPLVAPPPQSSQEAE